MALNRANTLTFFADLQQDVLDSLANATKSTLKVGGTAGIKKHVSGLLEDEFNHADKFLPALNIVVQPTQQQVTGTVGAYHLEALVSVFGFAKRGARGQGVTAMQTIAAHLFTWMVDQVGPVALQGDKLDGRLTNDATAAQFTVTPFAVQPDPAGQPPSRQWVGTGVSFVISQSVNPKA